jgi:transposase
MAIKRHKPEEIVAKLRQVEVLVGQGMARIDAIREIRIAEQTYYRWRKQYGGMGGLRHDAAIAADIMLS